MVMNEQQFYSTSKTEKANRIIQNDLGQHALVTIAVDNTKLLQRMYLAMKKFAPWLKHAI